MRIGTFNLIVICLIAGLTGALSIFSIASKGEMDKIRANWPSWSCKHVGALLMVSLALTLVLLLGNLLYQGIRYRKINIKMLLSILLKSLLASFIVAVAGNFFLLAG